jgi:hypothetical protein
VVVLVVVFVVVVIADFLMYFNSYFMYICAVSVIGLLAVAAAHKINNLIELLLLYCWRRRRFC